MVQTITPVVHGGRRSWRRSVALHAAGALIAAAALGALLGGTGAALGAPWGRGGLAFVAAVAVVYVAREATGIPIPIPELRRQVPEWWRSSFSPGATSFLYGLGLGVGFATHLRHGTLVAVGAAVLVSGEPLLGLLVVGPFGLARAVTVVLASGATTSEAVAALTDRLERWTRRPTERVLNLVALGGVAVAMGMAAGSERGAITSGVAPLALAATFVWAAVAKAIRFGAWRRSLGAYGLPAGLAGVSAVAVPALEAGTAAALLVDPALGAWASLALLVAFSGALLRARSIAGDRLPCGCFGGDKVRDVRLLLWRNVALATLALLTTWAPVADVARLPAPTYEDALPVALTAVGLTIAAVAFLRASRLVGAHRSR